jgi:photosystem II stability/assembly factor-like uncharacterized protein
MNARALLVCIAWCTGVFLFPLTARADPTADHFGALTYRSIGPAISGGRTTAVAGSNRDPMIYYAGGAAGGVFKSTDGGIAWHPIFDKESVAAIGEIAVAPGDPNDVWVGTGEAYPRNTVEEGAGVWHSTNGGATWQHVGLADAGSIARISIDPRDPRSVVVGVLGHVFRDGTTRGVYVTHDAGARWRRALYLGPSSGASDIARVPDHPATLFAGMWQFRRQPWKMSSGGPAGGIYRSDDGGATWRKLTGHGLPTGLTGRIGLAAGARGRIYAIVQTKNGDIWRSDDGGTQWQRMPHSSLIGARSFYFTRLYIDPANANRVINVSLILSLSTDGARTFHPIATEAGWDYHYTWWSADGRRLITGSDEGVVTSRDGGSHWSQPYDLPFSQPYHVGFDRTLPSYNVCVGLQDNSSWCGPSSADNGVGVLNRDWYVVGPGDGMWAKYDPKDPNLIWSTATNSGTGQVYLYDARTRQSQEVSPSAHNSGGPAATLKYRFNWDTPIAFTADGTALVGGNVLFASTDHGAHWATRSPDLTRNVKAHQQMSGGPITEDASGAEMADTILQIVPLESTPGQIWIGTDDGLVQLTRDNGVTWKNVTPPAMPAWGRVYTIEPGHGAPGSAYIAVDAHMTGDDRPHIFATDDYGATWQSLAGNLPPDQFVRSIREDPKNTQFLYAGTRRGVWVSFDRGGRWHSLRLNMPASPVYDLQLQPDADDLIVATHGRGVWILDDLRALQEWSSSSAPAARLFEPRTAYRMWRTAPVNTFLHASLPSGEFVGGDRPYAALFTYDLARPARRVSLDILDASAHTVRHLSDKSVTRHAGMNRTTWDLAETAPIRWKDTFEQNRGPESGALALPGTYTVRLNVDGATVTQPLVVTADPRDTATPAQIEAQHTLLTALSAELSRVDSMLNAIDVRSTHASAPERAALLAFKHRLTLDPRNIEDLGTAQLRERLLDLLGRVGSTSFAPPTATQEEEAVSLRAQTQSLSDAYAHLK